MGGKWQDANLVDVIDIKHGYAFPGRNIREEMTGDILVTPGNIAVGGGFKADKFKYFDGEVSNEFVLTEGDLIVTMTDLSKQADTLGYPALVPRSHRKRFLHNQSSRGAILSFRPLCGPTIRLRRSTSTTWGSSTEERVSIYT